MENDIEDEILTLAKKYDMVLSQFDNFLIELLLFKLFESPRDILPDYKKKYYKIAFEKNLISKIDVMNLKEWRKIRNFLTHEPDEDIIPHFEEYNKTFQLINKRLELLQHVVEKAIKEEVLIYRKIRIANQINEFEQIINKIEMEPEEIDFEIKARMSWDISSACSRLKRYKLDEKAGIEGNG